MKFLVAYLVFTLAVIAWCIAGILGWPVAGDPVVDAICLPVNVAWLVWDLWLMKRTRELDRREATR